MHDSSPSPPRPHSAHVFCRVVDNFGDAAVCWRLARQFAVEHRIATTLFIDQPAVLARLVPAFDPAARDAVVDGVRVSPFDAPADGLPDMVIEAFGCGLPDSYLHAMAAAPRAPCWINLEYLSAEPWIGVASPQPRLPLTRYFFMPGFSSRSGGLLRERDLLERRARWDANGSATPWWQRHATAVPQDALTVSLFCYPNPALPALFDAWSSGDTQVVCIVPEGVAVEAQRAWLGRALIAGERVERRNLALAGWPFLPQGEYDHLLWSCALNVVRGEDSFVRAQWAARPLVWNIYPQEDNAHRVKLDAFLERYLEDAPAAASIRDFWHAFNAEDGEGCAAAWSEVRPALPSWNTHAAAWTRSLATHADLAQALVDFCSGRI
jgi:uncharacterized repeat protein (TIGR03837 family)